MNKVENYDIVFLGGRIAGGLASRFIQLNFKNKRILVLEKNEVLHWSPGESTVGVAGLFFIRELGLSTYCYLNHLPKNGFRFLFDDIEQPFDERNCSEIGSRALPAFPTFQMDRARFDTDIWELNKKIGIETIAGADVTDIKIGNGENHIIEYIVNGVKHTVSTEWLVNSSGRESKVNQFFNDRNPVISSGKLNTASAWGRFSNLADLDLMGDEEWRARAGHSSRYLSTTHFMGKGSWIWHIPIDRDIVSLGIVYDKSIVTDDSSTKEGFLNLLKKNRFTTKIIQNSELLDFQQAPSLDFKKEFFALPEKVIFMGDAYGFLDPLYSQGSDIISRQCYHLKTLLNSGNNYEKHRLMINQFITNELEYLSTIYKNQYAGFGSFETYNVKSKWDFYNYTNRLVWLFFTKKYNDIEWVEHELDNHVLTMKIISAVQNGFIELRKHLEENGDYYKNNVSAQYIAKQNRFVIEELMLAQKYTDELSRNNNFSASALVISEMVEIKFGLKNLISNKLFQEGLTMTAITEFELNRTWLENYISKLSKRLKFILVEQDIITMDEKLNLSIEDFIHGKYFRDNVKGEVLEKINMFLFAIKENEVHLQMNHLEIKNNSNLANFNNTDKNE